MASFYDPANWYWIVGGDTTRVFSSKIGNYVPVTDPTYTAWLALGNFPSKIASEQELYDVLVARGVDPGILGDSAEVPSAPLWALKAAMAAFSGGDKEAIYTTWITANKATRVNLFYQWQCGNVVERTSNLVGSIVNNAGLTAAQMSTIFRDARKRAKAAGVS